MLPLRVILKSAETTLTSGPHPERARQDAELLLCHVLECDRAWLLAHSKDSSIEAAQAERYDALLARRAAGEPIQYITGEQEFFGLPFRVTPNVLIPRPETEHLVERVLELAAGFDKPRIVDVGAGSGAIAVVLAHQLPRARITAVDIAAAALDVARGNAELNGVAGRIRFAESDLLAKVADEQFEIVVSNPPYVPAGDRESLAIEVREHEPALALFAGEDGLDVYRRLIPAAFNVLEAGGYLALEIGYGQSDAVSNLLAEEGFERINFVSDLQGIPRVACGQRTA